MAFPHPFVPLFVYGSLRPGMSLWPEISDAVADARPGSVPGRLHWHAGGQWPLLLPGEGTVRGELLRLRPGAAANRVIVDEELRYGYDLRWVEVALDEGAREQGVVLVWPHRTEIGAAIRGGDYAAAVRGDSAG